MSGGFIITSIRNAGPVEDKRIEDLCSSYHCKFWKCSRSNAILTPQKVSPLWIFQPCRVRALWSIKSRILLETVNSVLVNRPFTKLHHGSYYTGWDTCQAPLWILAFFLKAFNGAHAFSNYFSLSGYCFENVLLAVIYFVSQKFNEVINQQRTSLFPCAYS